MLRFARITILLSIASLAALPGCGGGGGSAGGGLGRVVGRVASPSGGRAAEVITVSVEGSSAQTQAGADGSFVLDSVPSGLHTLIARSTRRAAAIVVEVKSGAQTSVGEVELRDAGQISGLVTSAADHTPIAGAHVTVMEIVLQNTADTAPHPVRGIGTNGDGSYTISGLPVGDYAVTIWKEGFLPATLSLTVSTGATTSGDVGLLPAPPQAHGSLSGTVYLVTDSGDKSPLTSALIRLARKSDPEPLRPLPAVAMGQGGTSHSFTSGIQPLPADRELYTISDVNGAYKIDAVPAGDYIAVAVRPGMEPDQKPVTIAADQAATADFTLHLRKPHVGVVEGTISDATTGRPIAGASVGSLLFGSPPAPPWAANAGKAVASYGGSLFITPDDFALFAQTDAQGHYQLKLPAGDRTLRAFADGYVPGEAQVTVVAGSNVTADIKITPRDNRQVTLSGHVTRADGDKTVPVSGATVSATDALDPGLGEHPVQVLQATTNDAGEYALKVRIGSYYVFAQKDTFVADPVRLDLSKDTTHDFGLVLIVQPPSPPGSKAKLK